VIETTRLADFSPVKNAEGVDSPESCKADQIKLFRQWFDAAGIELPADFEQPIEVSPLFATDEASFVAAWSKNPITLDLSGPIYIG